MPQFDNLIGLLDSRSFGTIWYWLVVIGIWSMTGRNIIGIPTEVVTRARAAVNADKGGSPAVAHLLDWLSLVLPRWQLGAREGAVFLGLGGFVLTSLAILGFGYGLELALAAFLLLLPLGLLLWLRILLARRLTRLLDAARDEGGPMGEIVAEAARRMMVHRRIVTALSMAAVAMTALWGTLWAIMHPYGF